MIHSLTDAAASLVSAGSLNPANDSSIVRSKCSVLLDNIPIYYLSSFPDQLSPIHDPVSLSSSSSQIQVNPSPASFSSSDVLASSQNLTVHALAAEGLKRKQLSPRFTSFDQLNFSDPAELERYEGLMDDGQRALWRIRNTKASPELIKRYSSKYLESLTFQLASNAPKAGKMAYCMNSNLGKVVPCENWLLCDRCAFRKGSLSLKQYSKIFNQDYRFFSVTLGFDGHLNFDSNTALNCRPFWEANKQLIRSLHGTHVIAGAFMVHELKISSFLPFSANPHSHALIVSNECIGDIEQRMQVIMADAGLVLPSSIRINEIGKTPQDRERVIRYLTKPIDLVPAYSTAWNAHCLENRNRVPELNREVRECYDCISAAFSRYKKIVCVGNLMPQCKDFIGKTKKAITKAERKAALKRKRLAPK